MTRIVEGLRGRFERALYALWFDRPESPAHRLTRAALAPLSALTAAVARRRRAAIRRLPPGTRPAVVVVGNLVVGGTGKTPATIALARELAARGWRVGLLAGGYRARRADARIVHSSADAAEHGDEAVLLARETGMPVAAGRSRGAALDRLTGAHPALDVVLSDDGLQHAGLPRSVEIAVFDGRGAGNGRLLPAGPLREPLDHAATMDALLLNGDAAAPIAAPRAFHFRIEPLRFRSLHDGRELACDEFVRQVGPRPVAAIAGIAQPERFFDTLRAMGLAPRAHPLPDHAAIDAASVAALVGDFVVMTSKDAVKCRSIDDDRCWALLAGAVIDPQFIEWLEERLRGQPIA